MMAARSLIGEQLRTARERMGLGLVQAADRLHVDATVIESLEGGQFTALGAPVFVRGHLRRYAELLGVPDAPLQEQYAAMQDSLQEPDLTDIPHPPKAQYRSSGSRWPLIATAIALVLALLVWWAYRVRPL
jgi:cytoskeleton protein RodZ